MRQLFLVLLLNVSGYVVSAQPLQQSTAQTVKQCRPSIREVLVGLGWAYAFKLPVTTHQPRPCYDNPQEAQQSGRAKPTPTPPPKLDSASASTPTASSLAEMPAVEVVRLARLLYIRPRSSRFSKEKLERELLKRREFGELGLEITRNEKNANLVLEITRKTFTTRFTCSILEPSSERIVGSTTASSLGGEIEPHLAEAIIKQFKAARSAPQKEK